MANLRAMKFVVVFAFAAMFLIYSASGTDCDPGTSRTCGNLLTQRADKICKGGFDVSKLFPLCEACKCGKGSEFLVMPRGRKYSSWNHKH